MTTDPDTPVREPRLTVLGWQVVVLSIMGAVVLVGALTGYVLLNRTDGVSRELSDNIRPARLAASQLQAALRDQEIGVRGYLISANRQFLAPYYDGQRAEVAAAEDIRRHLGRHADLMADLDAIERAAGVWRANYTEPLIASVAPNTPTVISGAAAERGKAEFDHLRELFDMQNTHLFQTWDNTAAELKSAQDWRNGVLVAILLLFVVTAGALAALVRSTVTLPLAALAAACRRITKGDFGEVIVPPRRPKDIRGIATDVENMRQRLVEELDAIHSARTQLHERAVELRRSNTELEQFAYVASHDLQEPLRKVASFCQLLEKRYGDQLDERGLEYIGYAVDGAKRMQVLINDLLTFSRVGRLGSVHTEVDLDAALDTALENLAVAIQESGAEIVRPTQRLPRIVGDPTLLSMLWQNLIGNAVKFRLAERTPRIVIECQAGSGERDGQWVLSVSDNGIGIAEEFTEKVFTIFQRLHGREQYAGTGMGLAMCKKIVEHHGGTIRIDTSYTGGTRFEFTLPIVLGAQHRETLEGARP
ncbi:histidine kinase [Mycobacterium sp. IS-836]|nr:histidine kinase [Mycobacterium sp. IS-836]